MTQPIKVLQFICPTGFYGAERWILALCNHLDTVEVESELAVTAEKDNQDLALVDIFKKQIGETHLLAMQHPFDLSIINKLCELIKTQNIDIIHTHGYKSDIIGIIAAKKSGIKCVVTPHGFENSRDLKLRFYIWLSCKLMKYGDAVVPLSKQLLKDLQPYKIPNKKLHYIQNGVDLSEVEAQRIKPFNKTESKFVIGFLGQLISRKNVFAILDIFNKIHNKGIKAELRIIGDGDQRAELQNYACSLASSMDIHFLGYCDNRLEQLQQFDLFVMTSTLEGIPRCLMEAMAMKIPVAAFNISGIDQLIKDNHSGLLAKLGDQLTLEKHWLTLISDNDLRTQLADNAFEFIYQNYAAQRMANEYSQLFNNLMDD